MPLYHALQKCSQLHLTFMSEPPATKSALRSFTFFRANTGNCLLLLSPGHTTEGLKTDSLSFTRFTVCIQFVGWSTPRSPEEDHVCALCMPRDGQSAAANMWPAAMQEPAVLLCEAVAAQVAHCEKPHGGYRSRNVEFLHQATGLSWPLKLSKEVRRAP